MRMKSKYCVVIHASGKFHIADFIEDLNIETEQEMIVVDNITEISIEKLPKMPKDGDLEKNKIYNLDGKACKVKEKHKAVDLTKLEF